MRRIFGNPYVPPFKKEPLFDLRAFSRTYLNVFLMGSRLLKVIMLKIRIWLSSGALDK